MRPSQDSPAELRARDSGAQTFLARGRLPEVAVAVNRGGRPRDQSRVNAQSRMGSGGGPPQICPEMVPSKPVGVLTPSENSVPVASANARVPEAMKSNSKKEPSCWLRTPLSLMFTVPFAVSITSMPPYSKSSGKGPGSSDSTANRVFPASGPESMVPFANQQQNQATGAIYGKEENARQAQYQKEQAILQEGGGFKDITLKFFQFGGLGLGQGGEDVGNIRDRGEAGRCVGDVWTL